MSYSKRTRFQHSLKNHHVYTEFSFYVVTVILEDRFLAILHQTEKLLAYLLGGVFFQGKSDNISTKNFILKVKEKIESM